MSPEDRAEERENEIMALESVYENELTISYENELPKLEFIISSSANGIKEVSFELKVLCDYDETYPETALKAFIEYEEDSELPDKYRLQLDNKLNEEVKNGIGSLVVYNVVSCLQELLQNITDEISQEEEEEVQLKKQLEEEETKRKFIGTAVTIESFNEWRKNFDAEMALLKKIKVEDPNKVYKLTGKELFLQDAKLSLSDLAFCKNDVGEVEVDESLFDLNDLDLEDLSD